MHAVPRSFVVSTLVSLVAVGCDRTGLHSIGPEGGSGGSSSGSGLVGGGGVSFGGATSIGGASVQSSSGGAVSGGGISGTSGGSCAELCAVPICADGYYLVPDDVPCGCPCTCWLGCMRNWSGPGGGVASGGTSGSSGAGGISHGGASGSSGSGGVVPSGGSTGKCSGEAPINHRPSSVQCPSQRGPAPQYCEGGTCTGQPYPTSLGSTCSSDSQCTAGVNGRCFPDDGLVAIGGCSYDECSSDPSCGARTPCVCRSSSTDNRANICVTASNCAVDSDCGPCGYCSPSMETCSPTDSEALVEGVSGPNPYYCHTAFDLCMNDSDCGSLDAGLSLTYTACAYNPQDLRWECTQLVCNIP
jgi:hypothetical protein